MRKLEELLLAQEARKATPIYEETETDNEEVGYVENAKVGYLISFNFYFSPKADQSIKLRKVISGKILENNKEEKYHIVETKNKLKYKVPYEAVSWVRTGKRWPRAIYEAMKKGTVRIDDNDSNTSTEAIDDSINFEQADIKQEELKTTTSSDDMFKL